MTVKQAGRKRWEKLRPEERREVAAKGRKTAWSKMTPEERSAEMKRRAAKRKKSAKK